MITNPNARLHVSLDKDTNPTLADEWLSPEEVQEREDVRRQWINKQHSFSWDNTFLQDWPNFTTRDQPSQPPPSSSEGDPDGAIMFSPEGEILSDSEVALPLSP